MTLNRYGPSGEATAQVVYANYGRPEDFDYLESVDVSVRGKIVLVRYGECFRGLKVLNAQTRGAVGTLIYRSEKTTKLHYEVDSLFSLFSGCGCTSLFQYSEP